MAVCFCFSFHVEPGGTMLSSNKREVESEVPSHAQPIFGITETTGKVPEFPVFVVPRGAIN